MENKSSTKTIVLTVLLSLAGAALFGGSLSLIFGARHYMIFTLFIIGLIGVPLTVRSLFETRNKRSLMLAAAFLEDKEGIIESWTIEKKDWQKYYEKSKNDLVEDQLYLPAGISILAFAIMSFILSDTFGWTTSLLYSLLIGLALYPVLYIGYGMYIKNRMRLLGNPLKGTVYFSPSKVLINQLIIELDGFGRFVSKAQIEEDSTYSVIDLTVSSQIGQRSTHTSYKIPIPTHKIDEAKKLAEKYQYSGKENRKKKNALSALEDLVDKG